jgi:hypothetical protein
MPEATLMDAIVIAAAGAQAEMKQTSLALLLEDVIEMTLALHADVPSRSEVEQSGNRLISADLVRVDDGGLSPTGAGVELCRAVRRLQPANRVKKLAERLAETPVTNRPVAWQVPDSDWDAAINARTDRQRKRVADRLHILDGLLRAFDMAEHIFRLALSSRGRAEMRAVLTQPPYSFSDVQANHILDLTVSRFSQEARRAIQREAQEIRATGLS